MIKLPAIERIIQFNSVGETTKQVYAGTFRVKVILTVSEQIEIEKLYAQLLPHDKNASQSSKLLAATLAELQVRVLQGPIWWDNSQYGKTLYDQNILYELLIKINETIEEWKKELNDITANSQPN